MKGKIEGFDGLRGIAAIAVVLTHLRSFKILGDSGLVPIINGEAGVQLFFVLSGFLITMLLIKENDGFDRVSLKNFYMRRAFRIFPVFYFSMAFVTLITIFIYPVANGKSLFFAYSYLYNFIPRVWKSPQLGHTWSLAVEEHFYLVWPFIFCLFYQNKRKFLQIITFCFIILSFFLNIWLINVENLNNTFNIERWSFISGSNILIGCLNALLICGKEKNKLAIKFFESKRFLLVGAIMLGNTLYLNIGNHPITCYLRGLGFGVLVAWIFLNQKSKLVQILELRPIRFCGTISYGIYIYQGFFLSTGPYRAPGQPWPPSPKVGVILLCFIAPISYYLFERPLLQLGNKFRRAPGDDQKVSGIEVKHSLPVPAGNASIGGNP